MKRRVSPEESRPIIEAILSGERVLDEDVVIERGGRPVAVLMSAAHYDAVMKSLARPVPRGGLALLAGGAGISDEDIDAVIAEVYRNRDDDRDRIENDDA